MGLLEEESQAANGCRWLSLGIHVITPNKRMGSGPLQDYLAVKEAQRRYGVHFLAEVRFFLLHRGFWYCSPDVTQPHLHCVLSRLSSQITVHLMLEYSSAQHLIDLQGCQLLHNWQPLSYFSAHLAVAPHAAAKGKLESAQGVVCRTAGECWRWAARLVHGAVPALHRRQSDHL